MQPSAVGPGGLGHGSDSTPAVPQRGAGAELLYQTEPVLAARQHLLDQADEERRAVVEVSQQVHHRVARHRLAGSEIAMHVLGGDPVQRRRSLVDVETRADPGEQRRSVRTT